MNLRRVFHGMFQLFDPSYTHFPFIFLVGYQLQLTSYNRISPKLFQPKQLRRKYKAETKKSIFFWCYTLREGNYIKGGVTICSQIFKRHSAKKLLKLVPLKICCFAIKFFWSKFLLFSIGDEKNITDIILEFE